MSTMQAYRLHAYGGPSTIHLDTIPVPTPGPSQVLMKVSKVGMNPFDWKIREGYVKDVLPLSLPTTLGVDFVGTVAAIGNDASSLLKVGDRVMTMSRSLGAFAEYIIVDQEILARVPNELDDITAATLPIPGLSAWTAVETGGVSRGQKVLIHGASGIVGAFAVQLAKEKGAKVIGTASAKNKDYVLGLGADEFVDYKTQKFDEVIGQGQVDVVLDFVLVGGAGDTTARSFDVVKNGGAVVSLADPSVLAKISEGKRGYFPEVIPNVAALEEIAERVANGNVSSKVARVFPRGELVEAMELNKAGGTTGRLIVDFSST